MPDQINGNYNNSAYTQGYTASSGRTNNSDDGDVYASYGNNSTANYTCDDDWKELLEDMQEELLAQKSEVEAYNKSAGLWDKAKSAVVGIFGTNDNEKMEQIEALLKKAIKTGNVDDIVAAYSKLYADNVVEETGKKISQLSNKELKEYLIGEQTEATEARQLITNINNGTYSYNNKTITMNDINSAILAQTKELEKELDDAVHGQGIISKAVGGLNNFLGFGTTEKDAKKQFEQYNNLVQKLVKCKDPNEYASLYKAVTGEDFNSESIVMLLSYNNINGIDSKGEDTSGDAVALDDYVNYYTEAGTQNEQIAQCYNVLADTDAANVTKSYIETREAVKDAAIGVGVAIGSTALAAATCGGSLAATVIIGAGMSVGANALDSVYDDDGNGSLDFNYTFTEAVKDGAIGGLNAFSGGVANKAGGFVTTKLASTIAKEGASKAAVQVGTKLVGAATEGIIDGSIGSGGQYIIDCAAGDKEFSLEDLGKNMVIGAGTGAVINVGIAGVGMVVSAGKNLKTNLGQEIDSPNINKGNTPEVQASTTAETGTALPEAKPIETSNPTTNTANVDLDGQHPITTQDLPDTNPIGMSRQTSRRALHPDASYDLRGQYIKLDGSAIVQIGDTSFDLDSLTRNLDDGTYIIGRDSRCDITISNDNSISRQHMKLVKSNGKYIVEDLRSTNGTKILGDRASGRIAGTVVDFDPTRTPQNASPSRVSSGSAQRSARALPADAQYSLTRGQPIELQGSAVVKIGNTSFDLDNLTRNLDDGTYIIGRDSRCDITIGDDNGISRQHLKVTKTSNGYIVQDLGSTNGTTLLGDTAARNFSMSRAQGYGSVARQVDSSVDPNELCRSYGNNGKPLPEAYVRNSQDVRQHLLDSMDSGSYLASPESYKATIDEAHRLAYAGKDGHSLYYKKNDVLLMPDSMQAGSVRGSGRMGNNYVSQAREVEAIAYQYGDAYRTNCEMSYVNLEGVSQQPYNMGTRHVYPDGDALDSYYLRMYETAKETMGLISQNASQDEILTSIARHYQYAANARPYTNINNSLFMNEINTMLKKANLPVMVQGSLDHAAMRLQPDAFAKYFIDFYKSNNISILSRVA